MRRRIKALLRHFGRRRWFRAPAMTLVRFLNAVSFRRLLRQPSVGELYVRGSFVRGPFVPFASDVDLTLILRRGQLGLDDPAGELRRLLGALDRARRLNPSLRDWWHHLLLDSEEKLLARYWYLYGCDEWRAPDGSGYRFEAGPADRRLLALAQWAQQCLWSASAVQAVVVPGAPFHDFEAGIRKAAFFGTRLRAVAAWESTTRSPAELFALRREHAARFASAVSAVDSAGGRVTALLKLFRDLTASAARIAALEPSLDRPPSPSPAPVPGPAEFPADAFLAEIPQAACLVETERTKHLVLRDELDDAALASALDALRRGERVRRVLHFLVPASALPLWPMPCTARRRVDRPNPCARGAYAGPVADCLFQRRLLLFETLFLPSNLRLALRFRDRDERLRRTIWNLARALALYERQRFCSTHAELEVAGGAPHAVTSAELGTSGLFVLGDQLAARLVERLASSPLEPAPARERLEEKRRA